MKKGNSFIGLMFFLNFVTVVLAINGNIWLLFIFACFTVFAGMKALGYLAHDKKNGSSKDNSPY